MLRSFPHLIVCLSLIAALPSLAKPAGKASSRSSGDTRIMVPFGPYQRPIPHPISIGLVVRTPSAYFAVWNPGAVFVNNTPVFTIKPRQAYLISGGRIIDLSGGPSFTLPSSERCVIAASDTKGEYYFWAGNRWYRGSLEIINYGNTVSLVNVLDLENYLFGVVPSEMPANWHLEALKSQAVAARSYAVAHMGSGSKWKRSEGFDVVPDVRDQAYKGLAKEAPSTRQAVMETWGQVLKDSNRVKPGFYRATVGDTREENLNVRQTAVPSATLEKMVGVPGIVGVTVKKWDIFGNATHIQILGKKKNAEVDGIQLAKRLGFATAGILDVNQQGGNWVFEYRGPGNGARGLSQHGAQNLAKAGWNYFLILQQYYQDADGVLRLESINRPGQFFSPYPAVPAMSRQQVQGRPQPTANQSKPKATRPKEPTAQASEIPEGPLFARPNSASKIKSGKGSKKSGDKETSIPVDTTPTTTSTDDTNPIDTGE